MTGRRVGRDIEDRILDVEPAADVDEPVVAPGQPLVAGRFELGDQPALENQRAELGARRPVVDDLRPARPGRRRRGRGEVRSRPAADRHRLADVQDLAGRVAEQVHARVRRQLTELGGRTDGVVDAARAPPAPPPARAEPAERPDLGAATRAPAPRGRQQRQRISDGDRVGAQPREQRAQHAVHTSRRPRARGARARPRSRARPRARRAPACVAAAAASAPPPPCRSRAGWATPDRSDQTPGAARGDRTARCVRPGSARPAAAPAGGSTSSSDGAESTIACVIPVKRWIPRCNGALVRHSELQRSCSSPPPTSTAPTSVISQASPARPLVSVSTTRNSAVATGADSRSEIAIELVTLTVIRLGPDDMRRRRAGGGSRIPEI